jgi:hypothetical protein
MRKIEENLRCIEGRENIGKRAFMVVRGELSPRLLP